MKELRSGGLKKYGFQICFLIFLAVHLMVLCFFGGKKINYHIDECFTYALANKTNASMPAWPVWEEEKQYTGDTFFVESLTPGDGERFNYKNVWENQKNDVHPPLYYVLVHTVCSFFPGAFSKWEALAVNFAAWLVIDVLVWWIAEMLLKNKWTALLAAVVNAFSLLGLNAALYLRMYSLMTVFVLGVTALLLFYLRREKNWKFYTGLVLLAAGGALTQYYFLIYLFFVCLTFGIFLLVQKKWKDAGRFLLALIGAGAVSLAVFPAMLTQIFGGSDRGQEAFENARTLQNALEHLRGYYQIINREIFGGFALVFLLLCLLLAVLALRKRGKGLNTAWELGLFLPSAVIYCFVVAVISPYMENRYVMAMGPLLLLSMMWLLVSLALRLWHRENVVWMNGAVGVCAAVVICSAMRSAGWMPVYTYQYTKEKLSNLQKYESCDVIYVYDYGWTVNDNVEELRKYKSYTFVKPENFAEYVKGRTDEELILYNESPAEDAVLIDTVMKENPRLTEVGKLFQNHAESIYYLK